MKTQHIQQLVLSGAALLVASSIITASAQTNQVAGSAQGSTIATGAIKIINLPFSDILPIYADLAGADMDTNQLKKLPPVLMSFENTKPLTRAEAVQLLDKVFYDHGIVATHVDKKHVVFTYRSAKRTK